MNDSCAISSFSQLCHFFFLLLFFTVLISSQISATFLSLVLDKTFVLPFLILMSKHKSNMCNYLRTLSYSWFWILPLKRNFKCHWNSCLMNNWQIYRTVWTVQQKMWCLENSKAQIYYILFALFSLPTKQKILIMGTGNQEAFIKKKRRRRNQAPLILWHWIWIRYKMMFMISGMACNNLNCTLFKIVENICLFYTQHDW